MIARAQAYPARPVRFLVPFAPGGPTDVSARLLATHLSRSLGQQFYIENQGGAGSNLGMGTAARSMPDGYTVLFVSTSFIVNPSLFAKIPYDPYKDFVPVMLAATSPNILTVNPSQWASFPMFLVLAIPAAYLADRFQRRKDLQTAAAVVIPVIREERQGIHTPLVFTGRRVLLDGVFKQIE